MHASQKEAGEKEWQGTEKSGKEKKKDKRHAQMAQTLEVCVLSRSARTCERCAEQVPFGFRVFDFHKFAENRGIFETILLFASNL